MAKKRRETFDLEEIDGERPDPDVQHALHEAHETVAKWLWLEDNFDVLDVNLAAYLVHRVPGPSVNVLNVDATSGGKTVILEAFKKLPRVFSIATLTLAGLLPGTPTRFRQEAKAEGLLDQIGSEPAVLLAKDFTSILSQRPASLPELLAALREIDDGSWVRPVAGGREWHGHISILGGVTEAIDSAHVVMQQMGQRFILSRSPNLDPIAAANRALDNMERLDPDDPHNEMPDELATAVETFIGSLEIPRTLPILSESARSRLTALATFAAHARTGVVYAPNSGAGRHPYQALKFELPTRLVTQLYLEYGGLRLIGEEPEHAYANVKRIALDCIPRARLAILGPLIAGANDGRRLTVEEIRAHPTPRTGKGTTMSEFVLRIAIEELMSLEIVDRERDLVGSKVGSKVVSTYGLSPQVIVARSRWLSEGRCRFGRVVERYRDKS